MACLNRIKQVVSVLKVSPNHFKSDLHPHCNEVLFRNRTYLYIKYLTELSQQVGREPSPRLVAVNKFLATLFGGYICNWDLLDGLNRHETNERNPKGALRWRPKFPWLSYLASLVSVCAFLHVVNITANFYASDFCRLKLDRLRHWISIYGGDQPVPSHLLGSGKQSRPMRELELELVDRLSDISSRTLIKSSLSASYGLLFEFGLVYCLVVFLYAHLLLRLLFVCIIPFDMPTICDLLARDKEQRRIQTICAKVVSRFIESSRQFDQHIRMSRPYRRGPARSSGIELRPSDSRACHLLVRMFEQGALTPVSKSPAWIERSNLTHSGLQLVIFGVFALVMIFLYTMAAIFVPSISDGNHALIRRPLELLLALLAISWLVLAPGATVGFYGSLVLIYNSEMILSINRVRQLIRDCIRENEAEFGLYLAVRAGAIASTLSPGERGRAHLGLMQIIDRMNSNYLFVLATYKVLQLQLDLHRRAMSPLVPLGYGLALLAPIFARFHTPYFVEAKSMDGRQFRWYALTASLGVFIGSNVCILSISFVHSRCLHLYKSLTNLMAHISRVHLLEPHLFDAFALESLKKELFKPDQFIERLAIRSCGLSGSIDALVQFYFWWGLATLSLVVDNEFASFGARLRDPLGVYSSF